MRIGLFSDTFPPFTDGVSTSVLMLKRGLEKIGHDVFVVTVNPESFKYKEEDNVLRIPGIKTGIYQYRLTGIYPIKAQSIIKTWKLDVIHSHTEFGIGTFARIVARELNIPVIHTYHTMYEEYMHYITKGHFDAAGRKFAEYLTMFYCDKTVKELIVPTKKTYDLFKEKYNIQRAVHIIPTGIDVERFHKENINMKDVETIKKELGLNKNDFVLLFIGRLGKEKNIDFILNNFKNLKKQIPTLKFVIVGAGPYLDTLKEIIDKEDIEEDVIFTGRVQYTQIPNYCHITDIFVTASTTETQGLTVIEAMSAGKPVVCANDESFKLVITDGQDGLFFSNEKEYEANILKLYKDKAFRERISVQAILTSNRFGIEAYAKSAVEVYKIAKNSYKSRSIIDKIKRIFARK